MLATVLIRDGLPLIGAIDRTAEAPSAMSINVRRRGEADELLDRGLRTLFAGDTSPGALAGAGHRSSL